MLAFQGDRKGRPYYTRARRRCTGNVQGRGDPCGRPGNHSQALAAGWIIARATLPYTMRTWYNLWSSV